MTRDGWVACEVCGAEYRGENAAEGCCLAEKMGDDGDEPDVATDGGDLPAFTAVDEHGSVTEVRRR